MRRPWVGLFICGNPLKLKPEVLSAPELLCGEALVRWMLQHAAALRQGCADKMPPMAYPASLPQLLVLAGIDRIGLADAPAQDGKLWPGAFHWRGIDGAQVLVLRPSAIEKPGAMLNPRSSRVKHVVDRQERPACFPPPATACGFTTMAHGGQVHRLHAQRAIRPVAHFQFDGGLLVSAQQGRGEVKGSSAARSLPLAFLIIPV